MSRQIQIRRGTASEHETFTGAIGEITMDITNNTIRVHDGETIGGTALAKQSTLDTADYVIETQLPTAENNYTWYRKYKSGWIEQGGSISLGSLNSGEATTSVAIFPIKMATNMYHVSATATSNLNYNRLFANFGARTQGNISIGVRNIGGATNNISVVWSVSGITVI